VSWNIQVAGEDGELPICVSGRGAAPPEFLRRPDRLSADRWSCSIRLFI
jgi:hypothetical protein